MLTLRQLGQVRIPDLVLANGKKNFPTTLPAFSLADVFGELTLRVRFVRTDKRIEIDDESSIDLGSFTLQQNSDTSRRFVVVASDPWQQSRSPQTSRLIQSLRLERFNPLNKDRSIVTSFDFRKPAQMPLDPLGYLSDNVVLLADEGFFELRQRRLTALLSWVQAGGSICVLTGGPLLSHHVDFLNALAADKLEEKPFLLDSDGRLIDISGEEQSEIRLFHRGMGRAALVLSSLNHDHNFDSPGWRRMVAFLWNVRADLVPLLARNGNWQGMEAVVAATRNKNFGGGWEIRSAMQPGAGLPRFQHRPIPGRGWLLRQLKPENVDVVPLGLIGLVLLGYVAMIGPADFLLLGLLKLRRLTWILFPLVTVGFTLFTVWLAHWYMQPSQDRRRVVFLDVGDDGRVVRRNRFEMLFFSTPRNVETAVQRELFTPFNHQNFSDPFQQSFLQPASTEPLPVRLVGPPSYAGQIPSRYTVNQDVGQWTPQVNRFLSIAPDVAGVDFDWNALDFSFLDRTAKRGVRSDLETDLRQRIRQAFGNAAVWVMHGSNVRQIAGGRKLIIQQNETQWSMTGTPSFSVDVEQNLADGSVNFLVQTCSRRQSGLFGLVSRVSPTGGDDFEDLAVLDATDPEQWLLVIAVRRGDDLLIYRKLYTDRSL